MSTRNVAILIFDEVEVLDFAGPFEVFSVTGKRDNKDFFNVYTVATRTGPVLARNQLSINPRYTITDAPHADIAVIPGGYGTRKEIKRKATIEWIQKASKRSELLLSVCTGALLLAQADLLSGLTATTHHGALDLLAESAPTTTVDGSKRIIDNGRIIIAAGVSAGIDMSLYTVAKLLGVEQADETAAYMEYDWRDREAYRATQAEHRA